MGFTMSWPPHSNDECSSEPLTKKLPSVLQMAVAVAVVAHRGGGVGGQHGGQHVQWEACTVGGRHILGRQQVGEWRGWVGGHAAGLGLCLTAGAGTARHTTGWEEDGEHRWGQSAHGVMWVHAIGGVAVAHNGAGDVRWVAGG